MWELEGSQNHVGRETEWSWMRDGIAVEGSWELVGRWMGLTGDEKAPAFQPFIILIMRCWKRVEML
eukprot:scaffold22253_cov54-Cyclotella_meneghiniana.AAC.1